jgi:sorbitol/mannitol transport system permease protein
MATAAMNPPVPFAGGRTRGIRTLPLIAPSVVLLFLWMIVPLVMTLWFSFQRFNILNPARDGFAGFNNYVFILRDPALWTAMGNTLILVGSVLVITIVLGTLMAVLFDQPFAGRGIARLLVIAPFFVMPTVSALIWKNMLMHPVNGLFAWITRSLGLGVVDWFAQVPLLSVIMIVSWQWIPFALLIILTSLQSVDAEQKEAARIDGAGPFQMFFKIILPHLKRPIGIVIMIETIFFLSIFAEILVTTNGGPGNASTNLPFLVYRKALLDWDVGGASAGAMIAVVLANVVAVFLLRTVARSMDA